MCRKRFCLSLFCIVSIDFEFIAILIQKFIQLTIANVAQIYLPFMEHDIWNNK